MSCKHERLKTVGFDWFCAECGAPVPCPVIEQKQPENPVEEEKPRKSPARKTAAKKAK